MARFLSLEHSPAATRSILRDRFARYLMSESRGSRAGRRLHRDVTLSDESLLRLLLNLRIDFASDVERARGTYEWALSATTNEPSLEELIDAGWLTVVWGRIYVPYDLVRAAEAATPALSALCSLFKGRFDETCRATARQSGHPDFDITNRINNGELKPEQVGCQAPEWVAARLWDRTLSDDESGPTALRVWFDRWEKLDHPSIVPQVVWDEGALAKFREAVFSVLESDRGICGWEEAREDLIKKYALMNNEDADTIATRVPAVPDSLVDRVTWAFDVTDHTRMREHEEVAWLVSLLLSDAETSDSGTAPHPVVKRLIELAKKRADLFFIIMFQVSAKTLILPDLVLDPATTAVACRLVAEWQQSTGAWDRDLIDRDNRTTKSIAFADTVSVLGHFLERGDTDPREVASLMAWFHQKMPYSAVDDMEIHQSLLAILKDKLSEQPRAILVAMVDILLSSSDTEIETSKFSAAVDIVVCGGLSDEVAPVPFVDAYVNIVGSTTPTRRRVILSSTGAAVLVKIALRAPPSSSRRFFYPIDTVGTLEGLSEEQRFSLVFDLGWSIRTHIRTLSGALLDPSSTALEEITCALAASIRMGALAHREKGRIAAFSPYYEDHGSEGYRGLPIAVDIGSAIGKLSGTHRDRILDSVLETDEPMLLGQLLLCSSYTTRDQIRRRIEALTPDEAGEVYSLTDTQARIETLLSAGLAEAAERFIEVERQLNTLGTVTGRLVARLRVRLRLHLLRHEWDEIASTKIPDGLTRAEQRSADEAVRFYKGLAILRDPHGDREAAKEIFSHLHRERPDVFAYFVNLFAVGVCILQENDMFGTLSGTAVVQGYQLLAYNEKRLHQYRLISKQDAGSFTCNKAQLLIALGRTQQALELFTPMDISILSDYEAALAAVAHARLNRISEAQSILEVAERQVGKTEVLSAAQDHITHPIPYAGEATHSLRDDVERVKGAFHDFNQMDHVEQSKVMDPTGTVDRFVISHVRAAASGVTDLVPTIRNVVIDSCEDDLNALFKGYLSQRVQNLGWSVGDQSKGGFTARGNPGERDLVIGKGSTTISIIEAVLCRRSVDRTNLESHLRRLLAYGQCSLFFLVVYSYIDRPGTILQMIREISSKSVNAGFMYLRSCEIAHEDSRPPGFTLYYQGEYGEVRVVCLVLDIHQRAQRITWRKVQTRLALYEANSWVSRLTGHPEEPVDRRGRSHEAAA